MTALGRVHGETQVPVPVQAPDQPAEGRVCGRARRQGDARAVRRSSRRSPSRSRSPPARSTRCPSRSPPSTTVSAWLTSANVAVTDWAASIVTHARSRPGAGARPAGEGRVRARGRRQGDARAVGVALGAVGAAVDPAGALVTLPVPMPALVTESVCADGARSVAVTDLAASIVTDAGARFPCRRPTSR